MKFISIFAAVAAALALGACSYKTVPDPALSARDAKFMAKVPDFQPDMNYERYEIDDPTGEKPGTIVVDTKANFLYYVLPNKKAIRYGAATGSEAFGWDRCRPGRPQGGMAALDAASGYGQALASSGADSARRRP